jgi:hypothetical protein
MQVQEGLLCCATFRFRAFSPLQDLYFLFFSFA